jgi:hypothetical protein
MLSMDIFKGDAFSTFTLTTAIEKTPFKPQGLGELNIFTPNPIRTTALAVEERQGKLALIPFSDRGQEGTQRTTEKRKMRYFDVPRLMHADTIYANELQNVRAFRAGDNIVTEQMQVEEEVARRVNGPTGLTSNIEYTWEFQRLAAIQGQCLDSDGSVKFNWFDEFEITQAAETAFNLAAGTANSLRPICNAIVRTMARKSQGAFTPATRVYALCGDTFYDQFVNHPDVIRTFVNWSDAKEIRGGDHGSAFGAFEFGGITWMNYRGSDDTTTIAVAADKVKFFPVNAPGIFQVAYAPGESFEWVNTPGKPMYAIPIFDRDRNSWWKVEVYSYPLHICTRPEVLLSGKAGA